MSIQVKIRKTGSTLIGDTAEPDGELFREIVRTNTDSASSGQVWQAKLRDRGLTTVSATSETTAVFFWVFS